MSRWKIGFNKLIVTPCDFKSRRYYLAGYDRNMVANELLDDMYVRTIWIDDMSGRGGVSISVVDSIGMSNKEVNEIRASLSEFARKSNTRAINVLFTHVHSAVDTQGLWGRGICSGRNKKYMVYLKQKIAESVLDAYNNAMEGKLYYGKVMTEGMIHDNRYPYVHDDNLVRMRFVPDNGTNELYILNIGCHPEQLGKPNHKISADWPCYMGRTIYEKKGAEFIFINGAIGAITSVGLHDVFAGTLDGESSMIEFGIKMGEYALSIADECEIIPKLSFDTYRFNMPAENKTFSIAKKFGLITNHIIKVKGKAHKYEFPTEVSLMVMGCVKIILLPGELFPELAIGGLLSSDESANGTEYPRSTLYELLGSGEKLIFGLSNDEIGYIIPDNDFYLSPTKPYAFWAIPKDQFGKLHYEETTCSGPYAAEYIWKAVKNLVENMES